MDNGGGREEGEKGGGRGWGRGGGVGRRVEDGEGVVERGVGGGEHKRFHQE